jgi:hypothetical protein
VTESPDLDSLGSGDNGQRFGVLSAHRALAEGFNRRSTMADHGQEVRSPWSRSGQAPHPDRLTQARIYRGDDWGHRAGHVGKAASSPASLRRGDQNEPTVVGMPRGVVQDRRR